MTLTPTDLARIDRYERDLEFIKARQAEVGRDAERGRLWDETVAGRVPAEIVAREMGETAMPKVIRFQVHHGLRTDYTEGAPRQFVGEVVDAASYDDLAAKVAALEQEIGQACVALCGECAATAGDDNYRLNRTQNGWVHHFRGTAEDWTPCQAALIRERAYQRELSK